MKPKEFFEKYRTWLIAAGAVFFVFAFFTFRQTSFDNDSFLQSIEQVQANDLLAAQVFSLEDDVSDKDYLASITGGLRLYRESKDLLIEAQALENIPAVQKELTEDIGQYVDLRIEQFEIFEESVRDNNLELIPEFNALGERIESLEIYRQGSFLEALETQTN